MDIQFPNSISHALDRNKLMAAADLYMGICQYCNDRQKTFSIL